MNAVATVLLAVLAFAEESPSQALVQALPADGSWTTFEVTIDVEQREIRSSLSFRSVGTAMFEGKPHRYLELEHTLSEPVQPIFNIVPLHSGLWRFLVPEEAFGVGKQPLARVAKIWHQQDHDDPVLVPSVASRDLILDTILRGPTANIQLADDKEPVKWQRGEVACRVVTGSNQLELFGSKARFDHRILRTEDVPFGVAAIGQKITASFGDMTYAAHVQLTLRDHGTDAQAKLPQLTP